LVEVDIELHQLVWLEGFEGFFYIILEVAKHLIEELILLLFFAGDCAFGFEAGMAFCEFPAGVSACGHWVVGDW
jgi:hypothetical protein